MNRTRRLRKTENIRRLVRENKLTIDDLIYPLFIEEGKNKMLIFNKEALELLTLLEEQNKRVKIFFESLSKKP